MSSSPEAEGETPPAPVHKRRVRYSGKNPRRFEDKYKELNSDRYPDEVAKIIASGKTPAGQHIPIMVTEVLECLKPQAGDRVVDATLGYGGHTQALWKAVQPGGQVLSLDADPVEIVRTEARLRSQGLTEESFTARRCNFAGLLKALGEQGWADGVDVLFADLGLSSMQIDNPARGFSFKKDGPLDMRMNPQRGKSAAQLLAEASAEKLEFLFEEHSDEPRAKLLAQQLVQKRQTQAIQTTKALAEAIQSSLPGRLDPDEVDITIRRVFQALRIEVNEELTALDTLLRCLPQALKPGARVAMLTFHSGEDRRVKKAFQEGFRSGLYSEVAGEVIRAAPEEQRRNSRSSSAKLRWAIRADS